LDPEDKRYIIGIDLGTTNSAVSYVDLQKDLTKKPQINIFKVPQLTGPGEITRLSVLPSFLYIPGAYDIPSEAILIPWDDKARSGDRKNFVGAFARDHGSKVPARLVSSAKSWICHSGVDRKTRILPWGAGEEVYKVSPVQATALYLEHIKMAWNSSKGDEEDQFLENQIIIITVPASFDEVARDLTIEAATLAGLGQITLLEEPLAAFYSWLIRHEHHWKKFVKVNELILVCDVGGGTTDFTLITLREKNGNPRFDRIAVGDHLILGGDNVDLALARNLEMGFKKRHLSLSPDRWKALCHQCRQAKEVLLEGAAETKRITLMGEGGKLIAGTISVDLRIKEVEDTVLEGFFPLVGATDGAKENLRKGITEFGLPYEQEPAITRHLGNFLERHRGDVIDILGRDTCAPDLILFNGGSLKPFVIQDRIRAAIRHWFNEEDLDRPRVLENPNPELSVAMGAAYYGLVKIGHGVRVGSGSARAFFLGVEKENGNIEQKEQKYAICLVERGLEEGTQIELKDRNFEVLTNQPVSFDIYSSSYRSGDKSGDLVRIDDSLTVLPPIQTVIKYGKKHVKTRIPVQMEANFTEIGTLSLWCRSISSDHRWRLQFQLRDASALSAVSETEIFDTSVMEKTRVRVRDVFKDGKESDTLDTLVRDISKIVGRAREKWPLGLIRSMSDELLKLTVTRNVAPEFESRWLNLTGFCLRPGFGDGFDGHRLGQLWKIYLKDMIHEKHAQVRSEWWIMWRRVAGGLKSGQQRQFLQDLNPMLAGRKDSKVKIPPQERLEIWMALANMEMLLVKDKIKWGRILLSEIRPKKCRPQHLWALSRIGARELLYGPLDRVIPPEEIRSWIETLLSQNWRNPKPVGLALVQLARKTGDPVRDIDSNTVKRITDWMSQLESFLPYLKLLKEVIPMEKQEETTIFGESLPSGIVLKN